MPLWKNVAGQQIAVCAWDTGGSAPKAGDAANITAQISLDGGACAATADVNPTELDAVDMPGIYLFDLSQAETNGDLVILFAVSGTANIVINPVAGPGDVPVVIYTQPPLPEVDVTALFGSVVAAAALAASAGGMVLGSAIAGTLSTTQMSTDLAEATDNHYVGRRIVFLSGTLAGAATLITAYNGGTKVITMSTLVEAPADSDEFVIV
jgi:hypothetical protein